MSRKKMVTINKEKVMQRLNELGITQQDLADLIDINRQHLCRTLSRGWIPAYRVYNIAKVLEIEPKDISDHPYFEFVEKRWPLDLVDSVTEVYE